MIIPKNNPTNFNFTSINHFIIIYNSAIIPLLLYTPYANFKLTPGHKTLIVRNITFISLKKVLEFIYSKFILSLSGIITSI